MYDVYRFWRFYIYMRYERPSPGLVSVLWYAAKTRSYFGFRKKKDRDLDFRQFIVVDEFTESSWDNFGEFIYQFQPETKTLIREL